MPQMGPLPWISLFWATWSILYISVSWIYFCVMFSLSKSDPFASIPKMKWSW